MAVYRDDPDLQFLSRCENDELDLLVSLITHDPRDGTLRWTENLSGNANYKLYYPAHRNYWREIAAEIQTFGASSIVSVFRGGKGVMYREVLCDVCNHVDVKHQKEDTTEAIELALLMGLLAKSLDGMSQEELQAFADSMGAELTRPTAPLILMAIQTAVKASGFAAYRLSVVMLSTLAKVVLGRSLPMVAYLTLTRSIGILAGPVGWTLSTGWLIAGISGPAWRVTVPACLLIACLRQQ
ncbi:MULTISPECIES: DUF3944 domain-containing protein [unclassified Enterobacter]|jgi:uncharacterized protein YaaW (UPF0174 family)|uniref:DUF3944 domain-containing protein n=1 Tax=unclassified Enterobacter TaxID=2608935 RepID=UPI0015C7A1D6|nr:MULTISPECIES: DUF3944 domain-containing protein [unclassified Enterobacter]MBB3303902.1 uncharacterized protein YaaW (UPF0174 family) [Enterobacter sp. Sphag1F]NYI12993.1 uncharacterized protein YaaW (UPF0174 family) [Enterobacter sp. Sphag71]